MPKPDTTTGLSTNTNLIHTPADVWSPWLSQALGGMHCQHHAATEESVSVPQSTAEQSLIYQKIVHVIWKFIYSRDSHRAASVDWLDGAITTLSRVAWSSPSAARHCLKQTISSATLCAPVVEIEGLICPSVSRKSQYAQLASMQGARQFLVCPSSAWGKSPR